MEIQNIYVLCARAEAPLPSHLCLARSVSRKKKAGMEKNILYFSCQMQDPSAQTSAISARNKSYSGVCIRARVSCFSGSCLQ